MRSSKSVSRRMSYSMLITDICVSSSFVMVVRGKRFMNFSFGNERSPLQLVTTSQIGKSVVLCLHNLEINT